MNLKLLIPLRTAAILLALITLTGCTKPPYTNLDNTNLKTMLEQDIPIIDVRRVEECIFAITKRLQSQSSRIWIPWVRPSRHNRSL